MTFPAQYILTNVVTALQDDGFVRWTLPELVRYFNDGQREIANARPDVRLVSEEIALAPGARQTLPPRRKRLMTVSYNTTDGTAITSVPREVLDATVPGWRAAAPSARIKHFMYDPREPLAYWVYPPASDSARVFATSSSEPTDIDVPEDGETDLESVYGYMTIASWASNALRDYILMRAFLKDSEYASNLARAQAHQALVTQALGVEFKSGLALSAHVAGVA